MTVINLKDLSIKSSEINCCADILENAINNCGDDCEVIIPEGIWFIKRSINVKNHKNFTITGDNATILVHFCNSDLTGLKGAFNFENCENLTVRKLFFNYDVQPSMAGKIVAVNREENWFDLKIFDSFKVNGNERLEAFNSVDEDFTPDHVLYSYGCCEYDYIGNNTFRVKEMTKYVADKEALIDIGHLINVRHVKYGAELLRFAHIFGCLVEDITIFAAAGVTCVVCPRCSDFTFNRCSIKLPENTERIFTSNADGFHIVGLTGYLNMKDCYFENMGDDALNMHSNAGTVEEVDTEAQSAKFVYTLNTDPKTTPLRDDWAVPGDVLNFYEQQSFKLLGKAKVLSYNYPDVKYEVISGEVVKGSVVANTAYFAKTHIDGCTVRNIRARSFLLQTENVLVENCHIFGMSGCAMILSPDIRKWHEAGPSKNVVIRNNVIEKCNYSKGANNIGAIAIKCCHDAGITDSPAGVHENIEISGNTFRDIGDSAVFALAVKGLKIKNNKFINCSKGVFDENVESLHYDVAVKNCDDVEISGNISNRNEKYAVYLENVTNYK